MSGRYSMHYSPSAGGSPQQQQQQHHHHHLMAMGMRPSSASSEHDKYLAELLAERQKLAPFMQVLPNCSHLLNQEIMRLTSMVGQSSFLDHDGFERESLPSPASLLSNGGAIELNGWASLQPERSALSQTTSWNGATGGVAVPVIKKTLKIEVPVDKYPNFNFVGRLLGPRGNTLKRVEQSSGCRVMIRGRGSIKDTAKEEKMRDKPGHEHLYEPLHVLVEAELPASIIDTHLKYAREILQEVLKPPVDDTMDVVKKAQLRELAILNGTLREESPGLLTGTTSPFNNPGMKRPKTRQ